MFPWCAPALSQPSFSEHMGHLEVEWDVRWLQPTTADHQCIRGARRRHELRASLCLLFPQVSPEYHCTVWCSRRKLQCHARYYPRFRVFLKHCVLRIFFAFPGFYIFWLKLSRGTDVLFHLQMWIKSWECYNCFSKSKGTGYAVWRFGTNRVKPDMGGRKIWNVIRCSTINEKWAGGFDSAPVQGSCHKSVFRCPDYERNWGWD